MGRTDKKVAMLKVSADYPFVDKIVNGEKTQIRVPIKDIYVQEVLKNDTVLLSDDLTRYLVGKTPYEVGEDAIVFDGGKSCQVTITDVKTEDFRNTYEKYCLMEGVVKNGDSDYSFPRIDGTNQNKGVTARDTLHSILKDVYGDDILETNPFGFVFTIKLVED